MAASNLSNKCSIFLQTENALEGQRLLRKTCILFGSNFGFCIISSVWNRIVCIQKSDDDQLELSSFGMLISKETETFEKLISFPPETDVKCFLSTHRRLRFVSENQRIMPLIEPWMNWLKKKQKSYRTNELRSLKCKTLYHSETCK